MLLCTKLFGYKSRYLVLFMCRFIFHIAVLSWWGTLTFCTSQNRRSCRKDSEQSPNTKVFFHFISFRKYFRIPNNGTYGIGVRLILQGKIDSKDLIIHRSKIVIFTTYYEMNEYWRGFPRKIISAHMRLLGSQKKYTYLLT